MTKAFNLSQLADKTNSSGQLDASTGLYNSAPSAASLATANFSIVQSGTTLLIKYGATTVASISSTGEIISANNVTAYGTP